MDANKKLLGENNLQRNEFISENTPLKIRQKTRRTKLKKYFGKTADKIMNKLIKINSKIAKDKYINKIIKKERNPGIDLVRLISMYNVVLNHFIFHSAGFRKYDKYKRQIIFLHSFTAWHNDGFALISGIVGYKTNKYSSLFYLWLTVLFYSVGIHIYCKKYRKNYYIRRDISVEFFPIIFRRYWYFTAYFGMYLFLPVINKGIAYLMKNELKLVVLSILGIFVFWRDYKNPQKDVFQLRDGYSVLWLLTLYLTGAYIGKYDVVYSGLKKYFYCFVCIFIFTFISYIYYKLYFDELYLGDGYYQREIVSKLKIMMNERFDALLFVVQSLTACLFFKQLYYNKYIAKFICFLGPLAFGIYLIHIHPIMLDNFIHHIYDRDPKNLSLQSAMIMMLKKPFKVFWICIFIEYLRNLLFSLLRIRKISIFLEKYLMKIIDYI